LSEFRRRKERWGSYNNYENSRFRTKVLDLRQGRGNAIYRNIKSTIDSGFEPDSLTLQGNMFNARVLAVQPGIPDRVLYPDIYASANFSHDGSTTHVYIQQYYLLFLRMEYDMFMNNPSTAFRRHDDPDNVRNDVVRTTSRHGWAISARPCVNFPALSKGDEVKVHLPIQYSFRGAKVMELIKANSYEGDNLQPSSSTPASPGSPQAPVSPRPAAAPTPQPS